MGTRVAHLKSAKFRIEGALAYYDKIMTREGPMGDAEYDQHVLLMLSSLTKAVDEIGESLYKGAMIRRDREDRKDG